MVIKRMRSKWFQGNQASTFKKLLLSFIVVFFVPVIVAVLFYSRIENIMIDNAHRSHASALDQAKQVIDGYINEMNRLTIQLGFNPELKRAIDRSDYDDPEALYRLISLLEEMSLYNSLNPIIGQYYIYMHNTDTIISPSLKVDSKTFYHHLLSYEGMTYEEFYAALLSERQNSRYYPLRQVRTGPGKQVVSQKLTFAQSLPFGENNAMKATLFIFIDESKFSELFQSIQYADNSSFMIIDKDGRVLLEQHYGDKGIRSVSRDSGTAADDSDRMGRQNDYVTSRAVSEVNGWTFVLDVPKKIVLAQVEEVKSLALLLFLICFVLGGAACHYLAFRNYAPVRRLMKSVSDLSDQREKLNTAIHDYLPIVRSDYLNRLIRGRIHSHSLNHQEMERMNIRLPYAAFMVVVAEIDDCSNFIKGDSEQEWGLVRFIMANSAIEMLNGHVYPIELDRHRIALLINLPTEDEGEPNEVRAVLESWQQFLGKRLRTYITIGVSEMHHSMDMISQCYLEADNALEYKLVKGEGAILYYCEVSRWGTGTYYFPMELEVQFVNFIKMSDMTSVERLLEQIYEMNFIRQSITPEMSNQLFSDLLSGLNKLAASLNVPFPSMDQEWKTPFQVYDGCSSAEEMMERTKELAMALCHEVSATKTDSAERIYIKMKEYIDAHFMENSLSLHSISEHLQMSPSYLSVSFKKQSGQTISDYILRVRIEHSKALLANQKLTTTHIAEQIGYANNIGYIRAFKRLEGITPGQYRQSSL